MIRTLGVTQDLKLVRNVPLDELSDPAIKWWWVDFASPDPEEAALLDSHFHFHPLAIEDCLHLLQRPKLDYYEEFSFVVLNALNQKTLDPVEVDLFMGPNYIVSFHANNSPEIEDAWKRVTEDQSMWKQGPIFVTYLIMDKIVDQYFPAIYQIEDHLNNLSSKPKVRSIGYLVDEVFNIRGELLKLRRVVGSMHDLLYRILYTDQVNEMKAHRAYFVDVYDHLVKLSEMLDSSREVTSDMRDSYLSINSYRMNTIMITLTIITSIFIPLTFIAGIYGMNFTNMPELKWRYGYFYVLGLMALIAAAMFLWIKRRGWFDVYK